jgi:outer membrane receptor protein involved in Fe transport
MAPNPDLRWETKSEVNAGVDFSFLGGRLSGTIDYYNRTTRDLLWTFAVDVNKYGASSMLANCGSMRNQGVEVSINGVPVKMKNFVWNLGLTLAYNQNRVLQLGDDVFVFPEQDKKRVDLGHIAGWTGQKAQLLEVGQPVGNYYGFKFARIDEDGRFYGYDKDGNERLMSKLKEDDKVILGNALPLLTWGLSSSMAFYGVDLSFNIRGAIGGLLLNEKRLAFSTKNAIANGNMIIHKDNDYVTPNRMTDYYLEDGTFAKLGDFTVGYTFTIKPEVAKYLSKARIYVTGQNLVTITGYSGIDPEYVNMSGLEPGIEGLSYYPTTRTFMFGVNLGF